MAPAGERGDEPEPRIRTSGAAPIGFLFLRLEPTPAGVAMTVGWNVDIERRGHDRHIRSLDPDVAVATVRAFLDEYLVALEQH